MKKFIIVIAVAMSLTLSGCKDHTVQEPSEITQENEIETIAESIANTELTGIDTSKLVDKMHDNIFLFFMISLSYPQLYIKIDQSHLNKKGRSYSHYIIYAFFNTKQRCRLMVTPPSVMF